MRWLLVMSWWALALPTQAVELPGDSVYQLALPLTDQSSRATSSRAAE